MIPDMSSKYHAGSAAETLEQLCATMKTTKCDKVMIEMVARSYVKDSAKMPKDANILFEAFGNVYYLDGEYSRNTHCFHLDDIEVRQWWDTILSLLMNPYMTVDIRVRPDVAIIIHPGMGTPLPGKVKLYILGWDTNTVYNMLYESNSLEEFICPNTVGTRIKIIIETSSCKVKTSPIDANEVLDKMANRFIDSCKTREPDMHDALAGYWANNEESFTKDGRGLNGPTMAEIQQLPAYQEFKKFQDFQNWMMFLRSQSTPQARFASPVDYTPQTPVLTPEQQQIYEEFHRKMAATLLPRDVNREYADHMSSIRPDVLQQPVQAPSPMESAPPFGHSGVHSSAASQVPDDFGGRKFCGGDEVTRSPYFQYGAYIPPFAPGGARPINPISDQNKAAGLNVDPKAPNSIMAEAMAAVHRDTPENPVAGVVDDPDRPTDEAIELDKLKEKAYMDTHMEELKRKMTALQQSQDKADTPPQSDVVATKVEDVPQVEEGADFFEATETLQEGDTLVHPEK